MIALRASRSTARSRARLVAAGLALLMAACLIWRSAPVAGQAPSLALLSRDGRRALPLTVIADQEFVALDDLASAFQLAVREESGAITVSYKGQTIVLTPDRTIASVAGRVISLSARPTRAGGRLLVPLDFIVRAIAPVYDTRLDLRRPARLLVVGDLRVPRVTMDSEVSPGSLRLTFEATPPATSTIGREGDYLTLRFDADALDLALRPLPPQGFAQGVRRLDQVTLAIDLGPRFASYRASAQTVEASVRTVLDLLPAASETTTAAPAPPPPPVDPDLPAFGQPRSTIRTVVIDPGHGGADEGVRGPGGLAEKVVTLAAARRVKSALEARLGLRVLLTRDDDRELPFDTRTAVANNNKADLFISLHANASFRPGVSGASVLTAAFADAGLARPTFEPLRVPVFGGGLRDIELVLWDEAQIRFVDQSAVLARLLQERFQGRIPLAARPGDRLPLRVLASANMPAVLIELGYLSNPDEEPRLASGEFQGALAQAIVDAVVAFRSYLDDPAALAQAPESEAAGGR